MVEFDEGESEQIFLTIIDLLNRNKDISYYKLKKSITGDESKIMDVISLLKEYGLLPEGISNDMESIETFDKSKYLGNKKMISEVVVTVFGESYLAGKIEELLLKENFLKVNMCKLNSDKNLEEIIIKSDIIVVESIHWSPSDIEQINRFALKHNKPWLYIDAIDEASLKIGPLFYGDRTGCYNCLISRILSNHEYPEFLISYQNYLKVNNKSSKKDIIPEEDLHLNILANYAVLEIKKFFLEWALPSTWRAVVKIEINDFQITKHKLLKKPYCEVCNPKLEYNPSPWLESITLR
ncbi:MAG: TOMM precursor leader peptide-binding protein [Bergeyella sp.]|nr:TOMM precursor leader peptide-binding protein [Bergeyella sp.]